jgi:hypothetical protein
VPETPRRIHLSTSNPALKGPKEPTPPRGAMLPTQTHQMPKAPNPALMDTADVQRLVTRELEQ